MTRCDTAFSRRIDGGMAWHSLYLDMHWPQRQILLPGPSRQDAGAAIDAAFQEARRRIERGDMGKPIDGGGGK